MSEDLKTSTKLLGGHIDVNLYWSFKTKVALRKETMNEAITHAIRLYLEIDQSQEKTCKGEAL